MATIYTWDCKTVDVYPTEGANADVVYNVHWRLTGTSDQLDPAGNAYSVTNIGTEMIDTSDITNFIPIEDVTNAEVTAWVETSMGAESVTGIEQNLDNQIALLITPTSITMQIGGGE